MNQDADSGQCGEPVSRSSHSGSSRPQAAPPLPPPQGSQAEHAEADSTLAPGREMAVEEVAANGPPPRDRHGRTATTTSGFIRWAARKAGKTLSKSS